MHTFAPTNDITEQDIHEQLSAINVRNYPQERSRQVPFTPIEILLCYGLFFLINPHAYGGANIHTLPPDVHALAKFFRRSPGSLTYKMLNLDGSRSHSGRNEPYIFATLAANPPHYLQLYRKIISIAREISITEDMLPDFLQQTTKPTNDEGLLGQDDLPANSTALLAHEEETLINIDRAFSLGDPLTEKLVERKIRLAQHRFARAVLQNCGYSCVFCGFSPSTIPEQSSLLRASHIKPWADSTPQERVDVRNGVCACPTHDAAFDRGYITIGERLNIHVSTVLQRSITLDQGVQYYFGDIMYKTILLPERAKAPAMFYLAYHQEHIFKGNDISYDKT